MKTTKRKRVSTGRRKVPKRSKTATVEMAIVEPRLILHRTLNQIVPQRSRVQLTYSQFIQFKGDGATGVLEYIWTPSNVYDVDPAIGGNPVSGFSEMARLYNKFTFTKSDMNIRMFTDSAQNKLYAGWCLTNTQNYSYKTNGYAHVNTPFSKRFTVGNSNISGSPTEVNFKVFAHKVQGVSFDKLLSDDLYTGTTGGTSPVKNTFVTLFLNASDGSILTALTNYIQLWVNFTLWVDFWEPLNSNY